MRLPLITIAVLIAVVPVVALQPKPSYNDSIVIAPLYIEYTKVSDDKFAAEVRELHRRLGHGQHVLLGFSTFLYLDYDGTLSLERPIDASSLKPTLQEADIVVQRALQNGVIAHIAFTSGFFHGWNQLREAAIREDVRNAQWFADGWIGPPKELTDPDVIPHSVWVTPSRYAVSLHRRMEESVSIVASHLATAMADSPDTLVSVSGDGEVELTFERNLGEGAIGKKAGELLYTDYSPFAVAEFRDWLRSPKYSGDRTPGTDDNGDGHTFNGDYRQRFATWDLKYFNESGPIPFASYIELPNKLPGSGRFFKPDGFDAPRIPNPGDPLWRAWLTFRKQMVGNYVRDFAQWVTTAPGKNGLTISTQRYYSHQIPADYLFEQPDNIRLRTSASPVETAFIAPFGGPGVTAYNIFDGKRHHRTATPLLLSQLARQSANWAVLEYNPSEPVRAGLLPSNDLDYYAKQLNLLYAYRPHIVVPFPWTEVPEQSQDAIQNKPFERALARFIKEIGDNEWAPANAPASK
jgi:hypothetical protein